MQHSTLMPDMNASQANAASIAIDKKAVFVGTHRVCHPDETLARIMPLIARMGITRVADITHLDDLGIPIFQAVRPNSRNISVSQGKGVTKALAKVSALMESIEGWHAEQPDVPSVHVSIGDMRQTLPYALSDLQLCRHHLAHDARQLEWFPASVLGASTSCETHVPADLVCLDFTIQHDWLPPLFSPQSNGLASGNSLEEATLHALYEVVERDTFERVRRKALQMMAVDIDTIDGDASRGLIEKLRIAQATIHISYACGATNIACFEVMITSPGYPIITGGCGCHLDRDVALSRALTEAAQTRLTMIAGSRDDIRSASYKRLQGRYVFSTFLQEKRSSEVNFHDVPSVSSPSLQQDFRTVVQRVYAAFGASPLLVNLTRQEFGIPVVFVIVPKALCWETLK